MSAEDRTSRLETLFAQAILLPRAERASFVHRLCSDDEALAEELASLLESHESADEFFDGLARAVLAPAADAIVARGPSDVPKQLEVALDGRYRIERELGGGSISRVFLAEELRLARKVVIKVLPPELAATMSGERFRREIRLAAQLQHPHIVPLLHADAGDQLLYYSMPFVAGESLRARLGRDGALPVSDATGIWRDVLDALAHAHAHGIIHRDIKPGNVLLSGRSALIADFGVARAIEASGDLYATSPGAVIGTPAYMAPEQMDGHRVVDHRADIYAAALVMYEMLEGRPPFSRMSLRDVARRRVTEAPPSISRAECPPQLAAILLQCLAADPDDRPANASAVLASMDRLSERPATDTRRITRRRMMTTALSAVLLSTAAVGAWQLMQGPPDVRPITPSGPSLAVLPLENLSADSGDAALANGMTEELIAILSQDSAVRVAANTSVRALRDRSLNVRQIAESLHVSYVLEGSVQRAGSKLRMWVRLLGIHDGSTVWSATYDRELGDVFGVQDDIARAVAGELGARLSPDGHPPSQRRRSTANVAAYELYLRGKENALLRSAAGRRRGIELLRRATTIDSGFAAAHAALVWLYLNEAGDTPGDYGAWIDKAEGEARTAVALDETLADAYAALGWARVARLDLQGAESSLKRAVAIDPAVHRGYEGLARVYMFMQRPAEQLAAAERGLALDPYSVAANREYALALSTNDRCDEALTLLRPLQELDPPAAVAGVIRGECFARKQMWDESIAELRWASNAGARVALGLEGYVLATSGRTAEARALLAKLLSGEKRSHDAFGIALVYAGLRDYDHAFSSLDAASREGSIRVYVMDPLFDDLHRDPRFKRFAAFTSPVQNR